MEAITGHDALKVAHDKSHRAETKIDDKWTAMGQRLGPNDKQPSSLSCPPLFSIFRYLYIWSSIARAACQLWRVLCDVWLDGCHWFMAGLISQVECISLFFFTLLIFCTFCLTLLHTHLSSCRFLNGFQLWANFTLACRRRHHHRHKVISYSPFFFLTIYWSTKTFRSFHFDSFRFDCWWILYFFEIFRDSPF